MYGNIKTKIYPEYPRPACFKVRHNTAQSVCDFVELQGAGRERDAAMAYISRVYRAAAERERPYTRGVAQGGSPEGIYALYSYAAISAAIGDGILSATHPHSDPLSRSPRDSTRASRWPRCPTSLGQLNRLERHRQGALVRRVAADES